MNRCAIVLVALLLTAPVARAGEEPEHRLMIQALAQAAGFSPADSKIIADGSWSMDRNPQTTAFSSVTEDGIAVALMQGRVMTDRNYALGLLDESDTRLIDRELFSPGGSLSRIGPAALFHSLMHDPRRHRDDPIKPGLDAAFHRYLHQQTQQMEAGGTAADTVKTARLILIGQYMHQFVDTFVHPEDPLYGHAAQAHLPDRVWSNKDNFKDAAFFSLKELRILRTEIAPSDDRMRLLKLDGDDRQHAFCNGLVEAIADGYGNFGDRYGHVLTDTPASVMVSISQKVESQMNDFFAELGTSYQFRLAPFDKVTYAADGARFQVTYRDKRTAVDNFVAWMFGQPKYADIAQSLRNAMRTHIRSWHALAERIRATGRLLHSFGPAERAAVLETLDEDIRNWRNAQQGWLDAINRSFDIEIAEWRGYYREAKATMDWLEAEQQALRRQEQEAVRLSSAAAAGPPDIDLRPPPPPIYRTTERAGNGESRSSAREPREPAYREPSHIDFEPVRQRIDRVINSVRF